MNNTLRFALAFNDINSSKFDAILYNVISSLLYLEEYNDGLDTAGIKKAIKKELDLDFGVLEIEQSINAENVKKQLLDYSKAAKKYSISEKGVGHFKKNNNDDLDWCIDSFIEENNELFPNKEIADKTAIKNTITKLLVLVFNSNKEELLYLLKNKKPRISGEIDRLNSRSKEIAIAFFDWNNEKKDNLVFKMIVASYEYCVLSLKKDPNDLATGLFSKKSFCLDSNVIYSAIGINGEENKNAVISFLKLCKQNKVRLCYFNYTKEEMNDTLHNIVSKFANDVQNGGYLDDQTFGRVFARTKYEIIHHLYKDWLRKPGNNKSFIDFERFLKKEIDLFLSDLTPMYIEEDYIFEHNENIEQIRCDIFAFKSAKRAKRHVSQSRHDAICYYYMKDIYKECPPTIQDQKTFFVTFDRLFYEWAVNKAVGRISTIVSVNVMYSLLLKVSGRTDNDAKSFNEFLLMNVSNSYYDNDQYDIKSELVAVVNGMERSDDSKKHILVMANDMLEKSVYSIVSSPGTPTEKAGLLAKKAEENFDDLLTKEHTETVKKVREEGKQKAVEEFERGKAAGIKLGVEQEIENNRRKKAKRKVKFNYVMRIVLACLIAFASIGFIILAIISFTREGPATLWGWVSAVSTLAGLIGFPIFLIRIVIKKKSKRFLPIDEDIIYKRLKEKDKN